MIAGLLLALLSAPPAAAGDWLLEAREAADAAPLPGESAPPAPSAEWTPYEPASRLFGAELPARGWDASEEEDARGPVFRAFGPDGPESALRATLTVRLVDRGSPFFLPLKDAVAAMRRPGPDRTVSPPSPLRVDAGLARVFEIVSTRRLPLDEGPDAPAAVHQYVAVIPRGDAYFVVRLTSERAVYLDFRDFFVRFLKSLRPIGVR